MFQKAVRSKQLFMDILQTLLLNRTNSHTSASGPLPTTSRLDRIDVGVGPMYIVLFVAQFIHLLHIE